MTARYWYLKKKLSWINSKRESALTRSISLAYTDDEGGGVLRRSLSLPDHRATTVSTLATAVTNSNRKMSTSDTGSDLGKRGLHELLLKSRSFHPELRGTTDLPSKDGGDFTKDATTPISSSSPTTEAPLATVGATGIPLVRYSRYASEYKEECPLGKGGFGSVFKCQNVLDGRHYAIKKVCIRGQSDDSGFEQRLERTLREVKILAVLDHPNIVRYFGAWLEVDKDNSTSHRASSQTHGYSTSVFSESASQWPPSQHQGTMHSQSVDSTSTSFALSTRRPQVFKHRPPVSDYGFIFERSEGDDDGADNESTANDANSVAESYRSPRVRLSPANRSTSTANPSESRHWEVIHGDDNDRNGRLKNAVASPQDRRNGTPGQIIRHTLYIQMQLCSPKTVADFLCNASARKGSAESGEVDIPLALRLFLQIAQAVRHVHHQGLIHRDLKPQNCFTDDAGTVRVGDFGLSRESADLNYSAIPVSDESSTSILPLASHSDDHTVGVGTRAYASPEQMSGSDYDSSTDVSEAKLVGVVCFIWADVFVCRTLQVFSLGIILFELLYPMHTGMERGICLTQLRNQIFPIDWEERVGLSFPTLRDLIQSMLSSNPQARPNAAAVTHHIHTIMSEFTILSLDEHFRGQGSDVVLLRVEAENRPDALFRTIQAIEESAEESQQSVQVVQYGLRSSSTGQESAAIMEFALKFDGAAQHLVSSLRQRPEIHKVRQVSMGSGSSTAASAPLHLNGGALNSQSQ